MFDAGFDENDMIDLKNHNLIIGKQCAKIKQLCNLNKCLAVIKINLLTRGILIFFNDVQHFFGRFISVNPSICFPDFIENLSSRLNSHFFCVKILCHCS